MAHVRDYTGMALAVLSVLTAWLFVPQITGAFLIKHHVATFGIFALVLVLTIRRDALLMPAGWTAAALALWACATVLSASNAENWYLAGSRLIEVAGSLLLFLCVSGLRDRARVQRHVEHGVLIAACGVALFALKQYLVPGWLDPGFHALGKMRIYSTLGNPSLAAIVILAGVPSAVWRALRNENGLRGLYAACTVLLIAGLMATQSAIVLAALGVMALVAMVWLGPTAIRRGMFAALALFAVVAAAALLFADLPASLLHSIHGRLFIWQTTWSMVLDHPLSGIGLGQFGIQHMGYQGRLFTSGGFDAYLDNAAVISEGHNEFLNWGALAGIPAMAGITLLCGLALWHGWRSDSLRKESPQFYLALVGYLFVMMFISVQSYPATVYFSWLLLGLVMANSRLPRLTWQPQAWMRYLMAAVVLGLLCTEGTLAGRETQAGLHEARGDRLLERHDVWLAEREYLQGLEWNGHHGELRKKYATVLFMEQRLDEALHELERARRDSGDPGIPILAGEILGRQGHLDRAAAIYREIAAAFPNMVGAHFVLGQIYLLQGERTRAEAELRKVLDITPSPLNLNLTPDKVELQKRIVREYFREHTATEAAPRS